MTTQHTPTPLTVEPIGSVHSALMRGRHVIAKCPRAVAGPLRAIADKTNAHDALVAALREIATHTRRSDLDNDIVPNASAVVARAALKAAGVGP